MRKFGTEKAERERLVPPEETGGASAADIAKLS